MMCQFSIVESKSATFPTEKPRHLLDDSVLESHSPARSHALNSIFTNGISIGRVWGGIDIPVFGSQFSGNSERSPKAGDREGY